MTNSKYNSIMTSIMRAVTRKLSDILIRNLGKSIRPFNCQDEQLLRSPLVNCRRWLSQAEQGTLYKLSLIHI